MYILPSAVRLLRVCLPLALCLTTYLYLYPIFHGCVFPSKDASSITGWSQTWSTHWHPSSTSTSEDPNRVPFRLLVLADPQLEGDSSLPPPEDALLARLTRHWTSITQRQDEPLYPLVADIARQIWLEDLPEAFQTLRKQLDLFGNDYYLGHIYRTLHWWSRPTHVTVLGDLIGSQWVTDEEFEWRGWRYWNRVFRNGHRAEDEITRMDDSKQETTFSMADEQWTRKIINIAGNHDVGYAGDISHTRMNRFERTFGRANWDVRLVYPMPANTSEPSAGPLPSLHLIVLNSLALDGPAMVKEIQTETYDYLNSLISHRLRPVEDRTSFTLFLTHLPLHKEEGICVDAPYFDYWGNDDGGDNYGARSLKEQNHLSEYASRQGTLEAVFGISGNLDAPARGTGRRGVILNGHDHEGCDTWHFVPNDTVWPVPDYDNDKGEGSPKMKTQWQASRWNTANLTEAHTGVREITLRSMMGDYGGNAGLFSAWFDFEKGEWDFDICMCGLNVKMWWAVHVVDLFCLVLMILALVSYAMSTTTREHKKSKALTVEKVSVQKASSSAS